MMQAGKLNILITAPSLDTEKNISGISSVVQVIIKHNDKHSYHHYLLGKPDNKNVLIQILPVLKRLLFFPFALWKNHIDIVHQNFPFDPKGILREFIINQWCRLCRVPVVLHVHGGVFLMNKTANKLYLFLVREIFNNSRAVIVLSNAEKESLSRNYRYSNAFILENCIDASLFSGIKREKAISPFAFLFMGRIHESKGLNDILEAFERLKKGGIGFKFLLCGDGPLRESIVPQFKALLEDRFEYWGVVSGQRKFDAIRSADCFLLPSRYGEGLPMALLETMATGLVPIVTDDASIKYIVKNEQNGMMVEKRSPEDLHRKMKKLILNPDLYETFSINARNTIAERCDVKNYIFQLNFIYEFVTMH
jgi:glycosyltransferase involved in cell wall biosynthesis